VCRQLHHYVMLPAESNKELMLHVAHINTSFHAPCAHIQLLPVNLCVRQLCCCCFGARSPNNERSPGVVLAAAGILDTIVVTQYSMSRTFVMLGRMGLVPPLLVSAPTSTVAIFILRTSVYVAAAAAAQERCVAVAHHGAVTRPRCYAIVLHAVVLARATDQAKCRRQVYSTCTATQASASEPASTSEPASASEPMYTCFCI
jgi:hypothetical protein